MYDETVHQGSALSMVLKACPVLLLFSVSFFSVRFSLFFKKKIILKFIYLFCETEKVNRGEGEGESQAGSALSAQSPTQGLNS